MAAPGYTVSDITTVSKTGWYLLKCSMALEAVESIVMSQQDSTGIASFSLLIKPGREAHRVVYLRAHRGYRLSVKAAKDKGSLPDNQLYCSLQHISVADGWYRLWLRVRNLLPEWREVSFPFFWVKVARRAAARRCPPRVVALQLYEMTWSHYGQVEDYSRWIEEQEPALQKSRRVDQLRVEDRALSAKVCFLLPLASGSGFNGLKQTLNSLSGLSSDDWRCIVLVACQQGEVCEDVQEVRSLLVSSGLPSKHTDLLIVAEGGLDEILDSGLELMIGQVSDAWVLPLLPGDQIAPECVEWLSRTVKQAPNCSVIVADEDRLAVDGRRIKPYFKTAWKLDAFLSGTGTGRAVLIKVGLLKQAGGFALGMEGELPLDALLYGLMLKLSAHVDLSASSRNLPVVLLHVAESADQHSAVFKAKVVNSWLETRQYSAEATPVSGRSVRVRWEVRAPEPMASLLVPTRDHVEILQPCIESVLQRTDYPSFEVIILDNQSNCPQTLAYLKEVCLRDSRVRVLRWDNPFNFAAINNFGARHANGSILALVNNDIEPLNSDWLTEMVSQACRPDIGCVGAKLYYPNGRIQHSGVVLGVGGVAGHVDRFAAGNSAGYQQRLLRVQNISAVTAACLVVRKELFECVGGMNEQQLAVNYNDVDLCLKIQALGYRNLWTPFAELIHHESVSRGTDRSPGKRARAQNEAAYMHRTWGHLLDRDPAYNPNLTLVHEDFSLRVSGDCMGQLSTRYP